jgi:hypothetical protein
VNLLLGSLPGFRATLAPLLLLLTCQSLLLLLQSAPFILFLSDVTLDTEHQQNLLPEFVIQLHVLFCCDDFLGNVHALKHL